MISVLTQGGADIKLLSPKARTDLRSILDGGEVVSNAWLDLMPPRRVLIIITNTGARVDFDLWQKSVNYTSAPGKGGFRLPLPRHEYTKVECVEADAKDSQGFKISTSDGKIFLVYVYRDHGYGLFYNGKTETPSRFAFGAVH
jgi:hypothetical protein